MLSTRNLKPCFFVMPKCSVQGGMHYQRSPEETEEIGTEEHATWETKRVINDKDEYRKAQNLRSQFLRDVRKLGVADDAGVIVDMDREDDITKLYEEWRETFNEFNSAAQFSRIRFRISRFRILSDNEQILKDMLRDMRETMDDLREMIVAADYQGIRSVVSRMKGWVTVLPDEAAANVQSTIEDARTQARSIKRALEKRGEQLEDVQKDVDTSVVDMARFVMMGDASEDDYDGPDSADVYAAAAGSQAAAAFFSQDSDDPEPDSVTPPNDFS